MSRSVAPAGKQSRRSSRVAIEISTCPPWPGWQASGRPGCSGYVPEVDRWSLSRTPVQHRPAHVRASRAHGSHTAHESPRTHAAASAAPAVANAAQKASPAVEKTTPSLRSIASRSSASWRASATAMSSGLRSHKRVLPSMSVKRNVTVPLGNSGIAFSRRAWTRPPSIPKDTITFAGTRASDETIAFAKRTLLHFRHQVRRSDTSAGCDRS